MWTYTISYDLRNSRDYTTLFDAINQCWVAKNVLESFWVVVSNYSAEQIFDYLRKFIDSDDWLIVLKSWRESKWVNLNCDTIWLQNNI